METLYKKVAFDIKYKDHEQTILVGKHATFKFNPNTRNGEELSDFLSGCEEIPDPTAQLKADKVELLQALENSNLQIKYLHEKFKETGSGNSILSKNKSLIQKHKQ